MEGVRQNLKLLGEIEPGCTINCTTMRIVSRKGLLSGTYRWLHSENKKKTIKLVEDIVSESIEMIYNEMDICSLLEKSLVGLNNLKITYDDDEEIKKKIDKCVTDINYTLYHFIDSFTVCIDQLMKLRLTTDQNVDSFNSFTSSNSTKISIFQSGPISINGSFESSLNQTPKFSPRLTPLQTPGRTPKRSPILSPTATPPSSPTRNQNIPSDEQFVIPHQNHLPNQIDFQNKFINFLSNPLLVYNKTIGKQKMGDQDEVNKYEISRLIRSALIETID